MRPPRASRHSRAHLSSMSTEDVEQLHGAIIEACARDNAVLTVNVLAAVQAAVSTLASDVVVFACQLLDGTVALPSFSPDGGLTTTDVDGFKVLLYVPNGQPDSSGQPKTERRFGCRSATAW